MNVPIPLRWRRAVALGIVALPGVAPAQDRDPFAPAPARPSRTVEVLHGATRVWPLPKPAPVPQPVPVVPPPRITEEKPPPPPQPAPMVSIPPIVIQTSAAEPAPPRPSEPITIVLANYAGEHPKAAVFTPPTAPWLGPNPFVVPPLTAPAAPAPANPVTQASATAPAAVPAPVPPAPATPQQPTVVVIREPAGEARAAPAAEAPRGVTLTNEVVLGLGVGVAGIGIGLAGRRRRVREAPSPAPRIITQPVSSPSDGVMLLGRYNAGPLPTTAEKFDMGPSYEIERQEKKKVEERNQEAVLEFILSQNLALHAEIAGPAAPAEEEALPEAVEMPAAEETTKADEVP